MLHEAPVRGFCDNLAVEQLEAHLRTLSLLHSRLELTSPNVPLSGAIRALHTYVQKQGLQSAETRLKMPFNRLADIGLSVEPLTKTAGCFLVTILRQEMMRNVCLGEGSLCNYLEQFFDKLDHADPRDEGTSLTYRAFAVEFLSVPLLPERFIHCHNRGLAQRWKGHLTIAIDHLHAEDALAWESLPAIQVGSHVAHRAVWTLGNAMDLLCKHLECELPEPQHLHDLIRICSLVFPIVLELHPDLASELESLHPHLRRTFGQCINNEEWINRLVHAAFSADDNVMNYNTCLLVSFLVGDDVGIGKTIQTVLQLELSQQKRQQRQPKGMPSASAGAAAPALVSSLAAETSGKIRKIVTYNHRVDLHNQSIAQGVCEAFGRARHKSHVAGRLIEQLEATRVNAQAKFQGTSESAKTTYASGKPTDPIDILHFDGNNKIVDMKQLKISLAEDGGLKSVKNHIKWQETLVGKIKSGKETALTVDSLKDVKHVILKDHYNDPEVQKLMAENPSMQFEQAELTSSELKEMIRAGDDGTKMSRTKDDPCWEVNQEELLQKLKKPLKDPTPHFPSLKDAALIGGIAGASLGFALSLYKAIQLRRKGELRRKDEALYLVAASTVSGGGSGALTGCLQTWGARLLAQEGAGMVALSSGKRLCAQLASNAGTILTVGFLGYEFFKNIRAWWRGEICGQICVKNCLQSLLGTAFAIGGGTAGTALGMVMGATGVGLLVCGVAGALLGGVAGNALTAWLLDRFFGNSKEIALANAYRYLGIRPTATSPEVKATYYKMALEKHPDKGGTNEEFVKLNAAYELIRAEREHVSRQD